MTSSKCVSRVIPMCCCTASTPHLDICALSLYEGLVYKRPFPSDLVDMRIKLAAPIPNLPQVEVMLRIRSGGRKREGGRKEKTLKF